LTLAERGELSNPATLQKETKRMLADQRATDALVNDFRGSMAESAPDRG